MESQRTSTTLAWNSKEGDGYRAAAYILTGVLLVAVYLGLNRSSLPSPRMDTTHYEEIDWAKFTPTPPEKITTPEDETTSPAAVETPPEPAPARVERINLRDIVSYFEAAEEAETEILRSPLQPEEVLPRTAPVRTDLDLSQLSSLELSPTSLGKPKLQVPGSKPGRTATAAKDLDLQVGRSSRLELDEVAYGLGGGEAGRRTLQGVPGAVPSIAILDVDSLGGGEPSLSSLFDKLVEWMKRHPSEFSPVVKAFLSYRPEDLTSKVRFRVGERNLELYLLCRENEYELRICLVEGQSSILLIDRGFKERSNYLRIGDVVRNEIGEIMSFETTQESPSDARTTEFYRIFLSWWKTQENE